MQQEARHVLLTGATGFIGSYVLKELLEKGNNVTAIYRENTPPQPDNEQLRWIKHDLENGFPELLDIGDIDVLIHLAWGGLPNYKSDHHTTTEYHRQCTFLHSAIAANIPHIFIAGTCFEYGMVEGELSESLPVSPHTEYGRAKVNLFQQLRKWQKRNSFSLVWGRLFYLYGKGQGERSLYSQVRQAIDHQMDSFDMSAGEQERDFLSVENAARLIVQLALSGQDLGAVNICSGTAVSVKTIVSRWMAEANAKIRLNLGVYPYPDYEAMRFWGNSDKLEQALAQADNTQSDC